MFGCLSRCGKRACLVLVCLLASTWALAQYKQPVGAEAVFRQLPSDSRQSTLASRHSFLERQKADAARGIGIGVAAREE